MVMTIASASLSLGQQAQPTSPPVQPRAVNLSFIVVDASNHALDDVQKDEIRLFENKQPQTISSFAKADKAVDYGIAIDTSGSFKRLLTVVVQAVQILIENQQPGDECFIERFISSDKIETLQEFTSDKALLLKALPFLKIEGGQSAVVDAVYVAVQHIGSRPSNPQRRKALVLFTDGEDRASYYSVEQLKKLLSATEVQLFIVGLVGELDDERGLIRPSPQLKAREFLKVIARESGGRVFFPGSRKELAEVLSEVFHDLHTQYEIGYESMDTTTENFHAIRIEVVESPSRKKVTAIARPGYYLNPPDLEKEKKDKKTKKP
jgi:Ca-activated chloride channel homolog